MISFLRIATPFKFLEIHKGVLNNVHQISRQDCLRASFGLAWEIVRQIKLMVV